MPHDRDDFGTKVRNYVSDSYMYVEIEVDGYTAEERAEISRKLELAVAAEAYNVDQNISIRSTCRSRSTGTCTVDLVQRIIDRKIFADWCVKYLSQLSMITLMF